MKVAHLNARSILTNFNELVALILQKDFDVITFTETWLSNHITSDILQIPGYCLIRRDREGRGGGVAAYTKDTNTFHEIRADDPVSNSTEYILIILKTGVKNFFVCTLSST